MAEQLELFPNDTDQALKDVKRQLFSSIGIRRFNNFTCVETPSLLRYFSYDACIAIYNSDNNTLFINTDYIHYSKTTTKHINQVKDLYPHATVDEL